MSALQLRIKLELVVQSEVWSEVKVKRAVSRQSEQIVNVYRVQFEIDTCYYLCKTGSETKNPPCNQTDDYHDGP